MAGTLEHEFRVYESDHPDYKRVIGSEFEEVLMWAHKKKYISLDKFLGVWYYTDLMLEIAQLWRQKDNS